MEGFPSPTAIVLDLKEVIEAYESEYYELSTFQKLDVREIILDMYSHSELDYITQDYFGKYLGQLGVDVQSHAHTTDPDEMREEGMIADMVANVLDSVSMDLSELCKERLGLDPQLDERAQRSARWLDTDRTELLVLYRPQEVP